MKTHDDDLMTTYDLLKLAIVLGALTPLAELEPGCLVVVRPGLGRVDEDGIGWLIEEGMACYAEGKFPTPCVECGGSGEVVYRTPDWVQNVSPFASSVMGVEKPEKCGTCRGHGTTDPTARLVQDVVPLNPEARVRERDGLRYQRWENAEFIGWSAYSVTVRLPWLAATRPDGLPSLRDRGAPSRPASVPAHPNTRSTE